MITSSSRGGEVMSGGVFSQPESSVGPRFGDVKALLRTFALGLVGLDQPVALEALQRRVDLADVERPHLAGARLELLLELEAVLRALAQQREDGVADAHGATQLLRSYAVWYIFSSACQPRGYRDQAHRRCLRSGQSASTRDRG